MLVCRGHGVLSRYVGVHGQRALLQPQRRDIRTVQLHGQGLAVAGLPFEHVHIRYDALAPSSRTTD
jgi:hypothetical protein